MDIGSVNSAATCFQPVQNRLSRMAVGILSHTDDCNFGFRGFQKLRTCGVLGAMVPGYKYFQFGECCPFQQHPLPETAPVTGYQYITISAAEQDRKGAFIAGIRDHRAKNRYNGIAKAQLQIIPDPI